MAEQSLAPAQNLERLRAVVDLFGPGADQTLREKDLVALDEALLGLAASAVGTHGVGMRDAVLMARERLDFWNGGESDGIGPHLTRVCDKIESYLQSPNDASAYGLVASLVSPGERHDSAELQILTSMLVAGNVANGADAMSASAQARPPASDPDDDEALESFVCGAGVESNELAPLNGGVGDDEALESFVGNAGEAGEAIELVSLNGGVDDDEDLQSFVGDADAAGESIELVSLNGGVDDDEDLQSFVGGDDAAAGPRDLVPINGGVDDDENLESFVGAADAVGESIESVPINGGVDDDESLESFVTDGATAEAASTGVADGALQIAAQPCSDMNLGALGVDDAAAEADAGDIADDEYGALVVAANLHQTGHRSGVGLIDPQLPRAARELLEVLRAETFGLAEIAVRLERPASVALMEMASADSYEFKEALERLVEAADAVGLGAFSHTMGWVREAVVARLPVPGDPLWADIRTVMEAGARYLCTPSDLRAATHLVQATATCGLGDPGELATAAHAQALAAAELDLGDEDGDYQETFEVSPEDASIALPEGVDNELLEALLEELPLQVADLSAAVNAIVNGGDVSDVAVARRVAHTVKGAANTVGIRGIATLTHAMEDILDVFATEERVPTGVLSYLMVESTDCLAAMADALMADGPAPDNAFSLMESLANWANTIAGDGLPDDDGETMTTSSVRAAAPTAEQLEHQRKRMASQQQTAVAPRDAAPMPVHDAVARDVGGGAVAVPAGVDGDDDGPDDYLAPAAARAVAAPAAQPAAVARASGLDLDGKVASESVSDVLNKESANQAGKAGALRVPVALIDELMRLAGEGYILTGQFQQQIGDARATAASSAAELDVLRDSAMRLEALVEASDFGVGQQRNDERDQFDALEYENYGELHSLAKRLVEAATDARERARQTEQRLIDVAEMTLLQQRLNQSNQDAVSHLRMVPMQTIVPRLERNVRQAARTTDKPVRLAVQGEDTPVDSQILADLIDPLMHLLRNAVGHGLEEPAARSAVGKPAEGTLSVGFSREGNQLVVRCRDDGRGLDFDAIRATALRRGLITAADSPDEHTLSQFILASGFTTDESVSQLSGRGVGLDVVNSRVRDMKGTMEVVSERGQGCCFEMRVPVALAVAHCLVMRSEAGMVTVSSRGIRQILHADDVSMSGRGERRVLHVGTDRYRLRTLASLLGWASADEEVILEGGRAVLLVQAEDGVHAIIAGELVDTRQVVVKSLGRYLERPAGIVGSTVLASGAVAAVVDVPELIRSQVTASRAVIRSARAMPAQVSGDTVVAGPSALVVDDSLTARRALERAVRTAGFRVLSARDGVEALEVLSTESPSVMLVDLEMPRMDGVELTSNVRRGKRVPNVPIYMVTSRSTAKHRTLAEAAGVTDYLVKPFAEGALVERLRALLNG